MKSDKFFILCFRQKKSLKKYAITKLNQYKMDIVFMNSENSKTFHPHRLILNLTDKIDLRRGEKNIAFSNLSIYHTRIIKKNHTTTINLKYQLQHGMINLNYLMDHI